MSLTVSIIIPTYNGEKFLKKTLESVKNQTYSEIEIIIIDDASVDNTKKVVFETLVNTKFNFIQSNLNNGFISSCNRAVKSSVGDYILILGQDDILDPNHIKEMVRFVKKFKNEKIAFVFCDSILINESGKKISVKKNMFKKITLRTLAFDNFVSSCGLLFSASIFKSVGGFEARYRNFGEWLLWVKMVEVGDAYLCHAVKSYYRKHSKSISADFKKINNNYINLHNYKQTCRNIAYKKIIKPRLSLKVIFNLNLYTRELIYSIRILAYKLTKLV